MPASIGWGKPTLTLSDIEHRFGEHMRDVLDTVVTTEFGGRDTTHEFILDGRPFILDPRGETHDKRTIR